MNRGKKNNQSKIKSGNDESFEEMLLGSREPITSFEIGDKVKAAVIGSNSEHIFLDLKTRLDGILKKAELSSEELQSLSLGQIKSVYITGKTDGAYLCSEKLGAGGSAGQGIGKGKTIMVLEDAFNSNIPVEGKVVGVTKGGFDVQVMGEKVFCPISMIDKFYCEHPDQYLNQIYTFYIVEFEEDGMNIVVSRKEYLNHEDKKKADQQWQEIEEEAVYDGTITGIKPFGVFVNIGAIEGLLHISEISYQRVSDPHELFKVGQKMRVSVKEINKTTRKVSFSLKPLLEDPWTLSKKKLVVGGEYRGKVVRMKTYGVFVELFPGVQGLVHISRFGKDRILRHPKEVLKIGDMVTVRVMEIDEADKKISLTMEKGELDVSQDLERLRKKQEEDKKSANGPMAGLFDEALKRK